MRTLVEYAINNRAVTYFMVFVLFVGGILSFFKLGQLEDPVFTVKTAVIVTSYPGASPEEVELEVTDRLEKAIQEMPQLKDLYSISRAGLSTITVDIKQEYWADRLPQVWDEMRKKIRDVIPSLPPGAGKPDISDDFSFVFGFVLAVTGSGFDYKELEDYTDLLKKELSLVKGVSRVDLWGVQNKVIYVDISEKQLSERGLSVADVANTLKSQNMVVDAGFFDVQEKRYRVEPTGAFQRAEDIADLVIRPSRQSQVQATLGSDTARTLTTVSAASGGSIGRTVGRRSAELIRIRDIATVRSGYLQPPNTLMRFNGRPALGISLAGLETVNIVDVGKALDKRIKELMALLPVGIEVHKITWQSDLVATATKNFMINLIQAVAIVLVVLIIPSGFRIALIIGMDLVLTILGTFIIMMLMDIPLERMSLGALIIAMGMMVDNAIVVSDNIAVKMRRGMDPKQAAIESAALPAWPLLSATFVASLAFYPIYASEADAGEYCRTLFLVIGSALVLSWLVAMTITPLQCLDMLPRPKPGKSGEAEPDEFGGRFFQFFRGFLGRVIRVRYLTLAVMFGLLGGSIYGFGFVKQMFFPDSSRPQLMIDYWAPEGTRIQQVSEELQAIEKKALGHELTSDVATFMGAGPPRFYLPVDPELPYQSYAELVVNFDDHEKIDKFIAEFEPWVRKNVPQALVRVRKFGVGPSDAWKFEARFSGPAGADLATLRAIGDKAQAISERSPYGKEWRVDMRQRIEKVVPEFRQERGRWAGVGREDVAQATKRAYDGTRVGLYREGDDLYPILLRHAEHERRTIMSSIDTLQVQPAGSVATVPLGQVTQEVRTEWENPIIVRWNRRRAITVQGTPRQATFPTLQASVIDEIDKIKLPEGYELFWDGEADSTKTAQASLIPGIIPASVLVLFLILTVFNAYRPLIIILLTIPFAFIGITLGLLALNTPFGFLALLGAMSLAGMMNKNIVVLLDAANENLEAGMSRYEAIVEAAVSRARPVLLAAATTVFGVVPLVPDVFWTAMAVTIMSGLAFGSILTLVLVPVLYCVLYRVPSPNTGEAG